MSIYHHSALTGLCQRSEGRSAHYFTDTRSQLAGLWEEAGEQLQKSSGLRGRPSQDHFSMTTAQNIFEMFLFADLFSLGLNILCFGILITRERSKGSGVKNISVLQTRGQKWKDLGFVQTYSSL